MNQNVMQAAAPIHVLMQRIRREAVEGKSLAGLAVFDFPDWRAEGRDELPSIEIIDYSDKESAAPGAKTGMAENANEQVLIESQVLLMLAVPRQNGLYGMIDGKPEKGLLDWVSLIRDAMDLGEDGKPDALLCKTCRKPFHTTVKDNVVLDLSWRVGIEVLLYPESAVRGTRRDTKPTPT